MKKLLIGKSAWLVSLMFLAAALGSEMPPDIAGSGTAALLILGIVVPIGAAYVVRNAFPPVAYLLALGACASLGGFAAVVVNDVFGHGMALLLPVFAGMSFAFQGTGIALALSDFDRAQQRFSLFGLCAGTGLLAIYVLFNPFDKNSDIIYLTLAVAFMSICLVNGLFYAARWTRVQDFSWSNAIVQTNRLFVDPIDAYRECLRNTDG